MGGAEEIDGAPRTRGLHRSTTSPTKGIPVVRGGCLALRPPLATPIPFERTLTQMTSTEGIRMTPTKYIRLQNELAELRSRLSIEVSDDFMDYDAKRIARHSARQSRIREIEDLLSDAVVDGRPAGDPLAEPGMVLTIRYDGAGETETFLLGRRGAEDADIKIYSLASPLGRAIAGARPGDQRIYSIPDETGRLVTLLDAVPYATYVGKRLEPQRVRCGRH